MRKEAAEGIEIPVKVLLKKLPRELELQLTCYRVSQRREKLGGQVKSPKKPKPWLVKRQIWAALTHAIDQTVNQFHITQKLSLIHI